ncbi:hypothetical protein HUT18_19585 [Streptomyces sp. NA04227]|uniref:DUF6234 family protein n=1 Tax=Streptomyces sp. NA04227 TaxID=2742136 RepID=UPI0015904356|nr:DUF6234 family protein [Streptomyces sp. NA04227]QKW08247.1 hypothetical protein HUT18_19585 [Streptomyces sp. NA04227]
MALPTAPAAFDDSVRPRAGRGADVGAAVGLLLLEVLALLVILGMWMVTGWSLDPARTVSPDPLWGYLVAAGVVGALAVVAAVIAFRSRALVTVWTQCFMAVVVVAGVVGGVAIQRQEDRTDHPAPAPAFTGEAGCRSGGDNSECADTGG